MRFIPLTLLAGAAAGTSLLCAQAAQAATIEDVPWIIQNSGGRYVYAGASLSGADCSGLVSVAQSLAMGQTPHRIGNTTSLLSGRWLGAIPGASPTDQFVIGVNAGHMVARVNGVNIESTTSGQPYKVGAAAASPWSGQFRLYHIDPSLLVNGQVVAPVLPGPAPVEAQEEVAEEAAPPPPPPLVEEVLPPPPLPDPPAVEVPEPAPVEPLDEPIAEVVPPPLP